MARLDDLRKLKYGWDGNNADPPTEEAIRTAEEITAASPTVTPNTDGGLTIEWRNRAGVVLMDLTITAEGTFELE